MNSNLVKQKIFALIKVISIVLMTGALGLELWNLGTAFAHTTIPNRLDPVFWIERFAVAAHLIEASIAASYASSRQQAPLKYGIYTFFVGTVGLLELFDPQESG